MNVDPTDLTQLREALRAQALAAGFSLAGFTTAQPLAPVHERRWLRWRRRDMAGAMTYLMREQPRRTHPRDLLPQARSMMVVAASYYDGDHPARAAQAPPAGRVARYAWGEDYHPVIRGRLDELGRWLAERVAATAWDEPLAWRAVSDSAPLDERAFAVRAGLGFIGKNTLLLHPEHGSWMLLGVLLLSVDLPPDKPLSKGARASCGACRRCLNACPTGALIGPYQMDPRLCISYQTLEQREAIAPQVAGHMQGWTVGCDVCQQVCPYNAAPLPRLLPELAAGHGVGPWLEASEIDQIPSGKAFLRRFGHTPLGRVGLKGIRRNLAACGSEQDEGSPAQDPAPAEDPSPLHFQD